MIGYLIVGVALVLFGVALGFVAVVSVGSHLAIDPDLTASPPSRLARGSRAASGMHAIRHAEPFREAAAYRHDLPRPGDRERW
jgi:hypothetical protein